MNSLVRGAAVLFTSAAALLGAPALAQDKTVLTTDREKASYMVGMDVGASIAPVGPDLDIAAFERAVRNAFDGGQPLLDDAASKATAQALMARIQQRAGQGAAGAAPEVAKDKVGLLVGTDVGRSLAPIQSELELPVLVQAIRTVLAKGQPLLTEAELGPIREAFSKKVQAQMEAKASAAGEANRAAGAEFLAKNKAVKGVFTTPSGLQYMVLRQGAGLRPKATDRVRVNYHGTLPDGTVFDSSVDRGQPIDFALNQVIAGWTEGVAMMPVGAKYRFWIPSDLAYGPRGTPGGPIGPHQMLVFDVELLDIVQ